MSCSHSTVKTPSIYIVSDHVSIGENYRLWLVGKFIHCSYIQLSPPRAHWPQSHPTLNIQKLEIMKWLSERLNPNLQSPAKGGKKQ